MNQYIFVISRLILLFQQAWSQIYTLNKTFAGNTFFDGFEFLHDSECVPSSYTNFLKNASQGYEMGIINTTNNTVYIGTDYTSIITDNSGRTGICIGTKTKYSNGLFILDASHMPHGCSIWPTWWMSDGSAGPNILEVDIIEGINLFSDDSTSMHTTTQCNFSSSAAQNNVNITGQWLRYDCVTTDFNGAGCTIQPNTTSSYGKGFNNIGGGVYAVVNNENSVRAWFWTRNNVPNDIKNKTPDPSKWGLPYAGYTAGSWCPNKTFNTLKQLRLDTYFCGWAGTDKSWNSQCQSSVAKNQTCKEFVNNNPSYFKDVYWEINYMEIYQINTE
eukprot:296843_1